MRRYNIIYIYIIAEVIKKNIMNLKYFIQAQENTRKHMIFVELSP